MCFFYKRKLQRQRIKRTDILEYIQANKTEHEVIVNYNSEVLRKTSFHFIKKDVKKFRYKIYRMWQRQENITRYTHQNFDKQQYLQALANAIIKCDLDISKLNSSRCFGTEGAKVKLVCQALEIKEDEKSIKRLHQYLIRNKLGIQNLLTDDILYENSCNFPGSPILDSALSLHNDESNQESYTDDYNNGDDSNFSSNESKVSTDFSCAESGTEEIETSLSNDSCQESSSEIKNTISEENEISKKEPTKPSYIAKPKIKRFPKRIQNVSKNEPPFEIKYEVWNKMYKKKTLVRNVWTTLFRKHLLKSNRECPGLYVTKHHFNSQKRQPHSPFLVIDAYCNHAGCKKYKFTLEKMPKLSKIVKFHVSSTGSKNHEGVLHTQTRGQERKKIRKKLARQKQFQYMVESVNKTNDAAIDNGSTGHYKNEGVVRKIRSEGLAISDLHKEDFIDAYEHMVKQDANEKYIQNVASPLMVSAYSKQQIAVAKKLTGYKVLYWDATGRIVRNLSNDKKRVFYYAAVMNVNNRIIPLFEFFSANHDANTLSTPLINFKEFAKKNGLDLNFFDVIVTDWSLAMINALNLAWNKLNMQQYLHHTYNIITNHRQTKSPEFLPMHLCAAHFMKIVVKDVVEILKQKRFAEHQKLLDKSKGARKEDKHTKIIYKTTKSFLIKCISILVVAKDLEEFKNFYDKICFVVLHKNQTNEVTNNVKYLHEKMTHYFSLLEIKEVDLDKDKENDSDDCNHVSLLQKHEIKREIQVDFHEDISCEFGKNIKESSKFLHDFRFQLLQIKDKINKITDKKPLKPNIYYIPEFAELLTESYIPFIALWARLLLYSCKCIAPDRLCNNCCENWFNVAKHLINEGLVNQKIGRVLLKHRECVKALCKIVLKLGKKGVKRLGRKTINIGSRGGKTYNEEQGNLATSTPKKEKIENLNSDKKDCKVISQLKTKEKNNETQWNRKSHKKGSYFPPYPEERYIKRTKTTQHDFVDVTLSSDEEDMNWIRTLEEQNLEESKHHADVEEIINQKSDESEDIVYPDNGNNTNKSIKLHEILLKYKNGLCKEGLYYREVNNFRYIVSVYDFQIAGGNKLESPDFEHLHLLHVNGHNKLNRHLYVSNHLINTSAAILNLKSINSIHILSSNHSTNFLDNIDNGRLTSLGLPDLQKKEKLLMPYHKDGNHWVLCAANLTEYTFTYYDSLNNSVQQSIIFFNKFMKFIDNCDKANGLNFAAKKWINIKTKYPSQPDKFNCGLYVLHYIESEIRNVNVPMNFDATNYRQYIMSILLKNSADMSNICLVCGTPPENIVGFNSWAVACKHCLRKIHPKCYASILQKYYSNVKMNSTAFVCPLCHSFQK